MADVFKNAVNLVTKAWPYKWQPKADKTLDKRRARKKLKHDDLKFE